MSAPAKQKKIYTPDDLLKMSDGKSYELDDGKLVLRPMGTESSWVGGKVFRLLDGFCEPNNSGWVLPSDASYQCFADAPTRVRKPDVSFIKRGRLPGERLPKGHCPIAPDLAVEVLSPRDLTSRTNRKVQEYRNAGVSLVWLVIPETRRVQIYRKHGSITELQEHEELTGEDVLPGFRCRISDILPPIAATESTK
jgi:Uma2 family endonuclease